MTQTTFYDPDTKATQGNCLQACIASALDLPLEEVPDFVQIHEQGGDEWWASTVSFIHQKGWRLRGIAFKSDDPRWLPRPGELCLAAGRSPRGVRHVVLQRDGETVWDPHPSRAGLTETEECWALTPPEE